MNPPAGRIAPQTDGLEKYLNSCHTTFTAAIVTHFLFGLCPCGAPSALSVFVYVCCHPSISNSKCHCLASAFGFTTCSFVLHVYFSLVYLNTYIYIHIYIYIHTQALNAAYILKFIPLAGSAMTISSHFSDTHSLRSGSQGGIPTPLEPGRSGQSRAKLCRAAAQWCKWWTSMATSCRLMMRPGESGAMQNLGKQTYMGSNHASICSFMQHAGLWHNICTLAYHIPRQMLWTSRQRRMPKTRTQMQRDVQ